MGNRKHQQESRSLSELLKNKLYRLFITCFLKILGKKCPNFVMSIINDICVSNRQKHIIIERYINGLKFDLIPDIVYTEKRNVYKLHKDFIDKLTIYVISYK